MDIKKLDPKTINTTYLFTPLDIKEDWIEIPIIATVETIDYALLIPNNHDGVKPSLHYNCNHLEELASIIWKHIKHFQLSVLQNIHLYSHIEKNKLGSHSYWATILKLPKHNALKIECKRILRLPMNCQKFYDEKNCSYKQLLNIAYIPFDIIEVILSWNKTVQLTLSYFDLWCRQLRDLLKKEKNSITTLLNDLDIPSILQNDKSPKQKSKMINNIIASAQHPIQTAHNKKIQTLASQLPYPCSWDPSLEKKEIELRIPIRSINDIELVKTELNEKQKIIQSILDQL